jgi:hypothetical protein
MLIDKLIPKQFGSIGICFADENRGVAANDLRRDTVRCQKLKKRVRLLVVSSCVKVIHLRARPQAVSDD